MAAVLSLALNALTWESLQAEPGLPVLLLSCFVFTGLRSVLGQRRPERDLIELIDKLIGACVAVALCLGLLMFPFLGRPFRVTSNSMSPVLRAEDVVWVNRLIYRFGPLGRNDVVVLVGPTGELYAKRVVGLEGDVIEVLEGILHRNGQPIEETFVSSIPNFDFKLVKMDSQYWPVCTRGLEVNSERLVEDGYVARDPQQKDRLGRLPPSSIPKGKLIVMGDNRASSADSRAWGLVDESDVLGRVVRVILPLQRVASPP